MKKGFAIVIVSLLFSTLVFANGTNESEGPKKLTLWTLAEKRGAFEPIASEFNSSQSDYEIELSFYSTDGLKDALKVAASSNTLPDIWYNWGGYLGGFYSDNGLAYNLSEYATEHDWENKFNPTVLSLANRNGNIMGYPVCLNVLGVYYRKDIFEKYDLQVPQTFEEFENVCEVLKANGVTPISTAGLKGWHVMRFVELLIEHYAGAEEHDKLSLFEESYAGNEAVIQALTKYKEFVDKGYLPDGFVTFNPDDTMMLVFSGQAAMDIQGQWYDSNILAAGQDINNYGVFPFPSGGTNRMSAFCTLYQMNANLSDKDLQGCIDFLDFFNKVEYAEKYSEYYDFPQPFIDSEMPEGQPNVEILFAEASKNGNFTITDQAFPTEIADALFAAQDAIALGEMTPEEGAQHIQNAVDAYFANN